MFIRITVLMVLFMVSSVAGAAGFSNDGDYFPLVPGSEYQYKGEFQGDEFYTTLVLKASAASPGFSYFLNKHKEADPDPMATFLGEGGFMKDAVGLYTLHATWPKTIQDATGREKLRMLPLPLAAGEASVYIRGQKTVVHTIIGEETVTVPAGRFRAVRVDTASIWPTNRYQGTIWLAPGVGVVKLKRDTGRVEELVSYNVPGTRSASPLHRDEAWETLDRWKGTTSQEIPQFHISASRWRVRWSSEQGQAGPGKMELYLYDGRTRELVDILAYVIGGAGRGEFDMTGSGNYYLSVNASQPYTLIVDQSAE